MSLEGFSQRSLDVAPTAGEARSAPTERERRARDAAKLAHPAFILRSGGRPLVPLDLQPGFTLPERAAPTS